MKNLKSFIAKKMFQEIAFVMFLLLATPVLSAVISLEMEIYDYRTDTFILKCDLGGENAKSNN